MLVIVFLLAMVAGALLAMLLERIAYRPLRRAPRLAPRQPHEIVRLGVSHCPEGRRVFERILHDDLVRQAYLGEE